MPATPDFDFGLVESVAALNHEISRQALMVAYVDDFQAMLWVTLAAIPLALMLRRPGVRTAAAPVHME